MPRSTTKASGPRIKDQGELHPPEIERDLPVQGGSEDGAQARHLEESRDQGVRKAGIVSDDGELPDRNQDNGSGGRGERA